jgi:hypothetical protein
MLQAACLGSRSAKPLLPLALLCIVGVNCYAGYFCSYTAVVTYEYSDLKVVGGIGKPSIPLSTSRLTKLCLLCRAAVMQAAAILSC